MDSSASSSIETILTDLSPKFEKARNSGALFFFDSEVKEFNQGGHSFQLRICPALQDKHKATQEAKAKVGSIGDDNDKEQASEKKETPPFQAPYIEDLFVGNVDSGLEDEEGMVCLFNKYAVIREHFLLVTKNASPQHLPPSPHQLLLAYNTLLHSSQHPTTPRRLIAFYNGGATAGASQDWRHIQFIQVDPKKGAPMEQWIKALDLPPRQESTTSRPKQIEPIVNPNVPYLHLMYPLPVQERAVYPPTKESNEKMMGAIAMGMMGLLDVMFDAFRQAEVQADSEDVKEEVQIMEKAWNLIITLDHIHLIPRTKPQFPLGAGHLEVNGLAYAGMLLVKSKEELTQLGEVTGLPLDGSSDASREAEQKTESMEETGAEGVTKGLMQILEHCGIPREGNLAVGFRNKQSSERGFLIRLQSILEQVFPNDEDGLEKSYRRRYWTGMGLLLVMEIGLLCLITRYIPFTNVDYRAYIQQSRQFRKILPELPNIHSSTLVKAESSHMLGDLARFMSGMVRGTGQDVERDYSVLRGETGWLVYPALHLYIYTILDIIFPLPLSLLYSESTSSSPSDTAISHVIRSPEGRRTILPLQLVWAGMYLGMLGLVGWVGREMVRGKKSLEQGELKKGKRSITGCSHASSPAQHADTFKASPNFIIAISQSVLSTLNSPPPLTYLLPLLVLSKRLHSIYVLRLFNDPIAVGLVWIAIVLWMKGWWKVGSGLFSLALGVKMNILFYLPGLLVLLFQCQGVVGTLICSSIIVAIQVILPVPYFLTTPELARSYFKSAFNVSRQFERKWSVNWWFIGEKLFEEEGFGKSLLVVQACLLIAFAWYKWSSQVKGGTVEVLRRGLSQSWFQAPLKQNTDSRYHIPLVLFTSNFIGMVCARSAHYQFYTWYAHQLPFLLWATRWRFSSCLMAWLAIHCAWETFPPSTWASGMMFISHVSILWGLWKA